MLLITIFRGFTTSWGTANNEPLYTQISKSSNKLIYIVLMLTSLAIGIGAGNMNLFRGWGMFSFCALISAAATYEPDTDFFNTTYAYSIIAILGSLLLIVSVVLVCYLYILIEIFWFSKTGGFIL